MKRIILILLGLVALTATAGESAADLLGRAAAKYQKAASIHATYSMTSNGQHAKGTITVSGNRFAITSPQLSTWYDGKTQWSYSPSAREVNITTPTAAELQQVNPFAVIASFRRDYNATGGATGKGKTAVITLTPKSKRAQITKVVITLDTSTLFPTSIKVTDRSKRVTVILVSSASTRGKVAASTFTFDKRKYPKAEVVDLR